jgi:WS/DGAT/MGAT family acyltransferase
VAPSWTPDPVPSLLDLSLRTARSLSQRPRDLFRVAQKTWPVLLSAGRDTIGDVQRRTLTGLAPRTRFNRQISARRSYAFGSLPLDQVKALKNALGATVNDVILGLCAEALREYLLERGELPEKSLIAGVPMSTRSTAQHGQGGNQVIFLRAALHTDHADPLGRLKKISREMAEVKERTRALPATLMGDWAQLPAPSLMAQAARLFENFGIQDYLAPAFNVVVSNVPGPAVPLYFAGMRVLANHPVSIPYHGLGFNITLMSYRDKLDYGLTADRDAVPDIGHFAELLQKALATLRERAGMGGHA